MHLSSRNARLEEKLAKSLAKNRSLARYYDQLLMKSREAQERDMDSLRARLGQGEEAERQLSRLQEDLERAVRERNAMAEEVKMSRAALHQADAFRREETASLNHAISKMTEQIAERDSELSEARRRLASQQYDGAQELQEMRKLLKQAREEREADRTQDNEVAKQLSEIKQQALDRIQENVDAQKEVAAVSEQLKRAEADTQEARRSLAEAEDRAEEFEQEAERLRRQLREHAEVEVRLKGDAAVAHALQERLKSSEREREAERQELVEARKRMESLNDKMALLASEKEMLVRHSAQSSLIETQLREAKFEIERYKKLVEDAALQRQRADTGSKVRFNDVAQVLRLHIFQHSQDNHRMTATLQEAREMYHMAQRSAARLVARAEREASDIVVEAVQAVQAARRMAAEVARELSRNVSTTMVGVRKNALATVQESLRQKEQALAAALRAEERAESAELESRRARMLAAEAGGHLKALLQTVQGSEDAHPELAEADVQGAVEISAAILGADGSGPAGDRATRKELARTRFVCMALALYKKSVEKAQNRNILMLQASVKLANNERRETQTRYRQTQQDSRARKAELLWATMAAAVLRKADQDTREEGQAVVYSLTQKTLQLQLAKKELDSALKTIKQHEANIAYLRSALDAQARGKDIGASAEELRSTRSQLHDSEHALDALGRKISMLTEEIRTVGRDIQQIQSSSPRRRPASREGVTDGLRTRIEEIEGRIPKRGASQTDTAASTAASNLLIYLEKATLEALVDSLQGTSQRPGRRSAGSPQTRGSDGRARQIGSNWGDTTAGSWEDPSLRPTELLSPVQNLNLQDRSAVEMLNSPAPRRKSVATKLRGLRKNGSRVAGERAEGDTAPPEDPFAPESIAEFHERISKWNEDFAEEEGLENYMDASRYSAASAADKARVQTRKPAPRKSAGPARKGKKAGKVGRYF